MALALFVVAIVFGQASLAGRAVLCAYHQGLDKSANIEGSLTRCRSRPPNLSLEPTPLPYGSRLRLRLAPAPLSRKRLAAGSEDSPCAPLHISQRQLKSPSLLRR